jgi:MinD-like ATPase involved in chromosome partitioning or flagellar assembly
MSGFVCPHCGTKSDIFQSGGGEKMAQEANVSFLGSLPIDPQIGVDSDKGSPFVIAHPDSAATKAFIDIVKKVETHIEERDKTSA